MPNSDLALRQLIAAIAEGDSTEFSKMLSESPALATARFEITNATRQTAEENFVPEIGRYIYRGDTALHFAAAAHDPAMIRELITRGAPVRATNRLGEEPLHAAAVGNPGSQSWNPKAQSSAINALINAGADPNAINKMGVAPLHKAVRTRCADAVRTLLACGANAALQNKSGSDAILLARLNPGRGGSGSPQAKAQQLEIIQLLNHG